MSKLPFVCLNVEPESEDDEEIDNTAEIKLEEALKLYQQALRLHAQGAPGFTEAQKAYEELFENEIFTYDEALSFRKRQEALDDETTDSETNATSSDSGLDVEQSNLVDRLPTAAESGPSTLRQVVYLSYKNYGQFQLDRLQHDLVEKGFARLSLTQLEPSFQKRVISRVRKALDSFSDALDKDDTDVELWRQVSRLTGLLGSQRLSRFCLETVLATNDDDLTLGLDEVVVSVVREELQDVYNQVRDEVGGADRVHLSGKQRVPLHIRRLLDPCPSMPKPCEQPALGPAPVREAKALRIKTSSWLALGKAILRQVKSSPPGFAGFETMCMGFRIEDLVDAGAKTEDGRSKRRKTNDELEQQRDGNAQIEETDAVMGGVDEPASPDQAPASPSLQRGPGDAQEPLSPTQEKSLPVRGLVPDNVQQSTETVEVASGTAQEKTNSLKRSPEAAGMAQEPPEARSRSKRLRARETGVDDDATKDQKQHMEKLKPLEHADRHLFSVCDTLLKRMSVTSMGTLEELQTYATQPTTNKVPAEVDDLKAAFEDFAMSLKNWTANRSSLILHGTGVGATATLISKGNEAGLANFLEHAKSGQQASRDPRPSLVDQDLDAFVALVNSSWLSIDEIAFSWLINMLGPKTAYREPTESLDSAKYLAFKWPIELKAITQELLSMLDDYIYREMEHAVLSWTEPNNQDAEDSDTLDALVTLTQTLFEIQLDSYDSMIKPTSKIDQPTRILQRARLQRWAFLSSQAIARGSSDIDEGDPTDLIALRHLFSMTLYLSLDEASSREHIISCLWEVKYRIEDGEQTHLSLPNVDIMPEISVDAVGKEISRLTTTDFFMSVFNPSDDDPVATIESLEPIIMPLSRSTESAANSTPDHRNDSTETEKAGASPSGQLLGKADSPAPSNAQKDQLLDFLSKSTASLRLSLWNRLTNAYSAIGAPPFVFLCTIHSINIILFELKTPTYTMQPETTRLSNLLIWIRNLIDLVDKCCMLTNTEPTALGCMDENNLWLALECISSCVRLFHLFAMWDDRVRLGHSGPPPQQTGGANAFKQATNILRDMQVKTWRLLYILLRESAAQNPSLFPEANDEFLVYIAAVHSAIGLREYCKLNKKSFLKFVKSELLYLQPTDLEEWRYQMAQVAYDLYDLRVLAETDTWMKLQEHNCPADQLDRATAREILPMIMAQIQGISVRDIIKPDRRDFKQTIDRIQDLIGSPKASSVQQSFNRKQLLTFQKTAIRGSDLTNALKGIGGFTNMPVKNEYSVIAKTGWYFIVGYLRLASFRSVKRTGPDSTKELDDAMQYLKFDIDFDCQKWETWFRLAQAYDAMLDEEVTWTADRINNKMDDLVVLQRQAIHCYQTAVALLVRHTADGDALSDDTATSASELHSDFGKRLYASSRPPFSMRAFSVDDHPRWYFTYSQVKFKAIPFRPMTESAVWLVSSVLFRQALSHRENDWQSWYMLGKCLWKMLRDEDVGGLSHDRVLRAFGKACELAPTKDSKHLDKGVILEPHMKLVSTLHKMVYHRGLLTPEEGAKWLRNSPYLQAAELRQPKGKQEWLVFAKHIIRNLRGADKSNWHHRIMARAAKIAFEDPTQTAPAEAAISQYTPYIFTKTMVIQVWRTLFERAGRHFVFTTRYVNDFIGLLTLAGDRTSLEALGKKVRKRQAEFIDHLAIWTRICKEHVKLLRTQAGVPSMHEEKVLFVLPYETFVPNAALLQAWAQPANAEPPVHPLLSALREAIDLKKLNLNLIPNQGIDDLIGDAYAKLYEDMVPGLVADATNEKNREAMRVDRLLMGDPGADERTDTGTESAIPLTNPSGRAKIVGRMEVRRRAEALVQRLALGSGPVKGKAAALAEAAAAQEEADESEGPMAPASPDANNDADDESELSELEDEPQEEMALDIEVEGGEEEGEEGDDEDEDGDPDNGHRNTGDEDGDAEGGVASPASKALDGETRVEQSEVNGGVATDTEMQ